jgi:hypothetical protein
MRESDYLKKIEKEKAKARQARGQGGVLLKATLPEANGSQVRDIVSEKKTFKPHKGVLRYPRR